MDKQFWAERLKNTFDSYELCFIRERTKKYEAADGELLSKELKEEEGISLRGIKEGRMVFSYTFEKGEKAASALLENGRTLLPFLDEDRFHAFPGGNGSYPDLADLYDGAGLKVADDRKMAAIVEMETIIRAYDGRITKTRNCELHESEVEVGLINSSGMEAEAKKTVYALSAMAVAAEGDDEVSWYDWVWSSRYDGLDSRALGNRVAGKTVSFLGGRMLDTGVYTGLFTPGCACQILEILSPSFLAENLYKKKTRLEEKTGTKVFSELLTLVDSGRQGIGAFPFDGEGVPSQENLLVRKGMFGGFLYDTYCGNRLNKASTGNAVRSGIKEPPRCGTRGFFVEAGTSDESAEFQDGLVIEELMGTHTANAVTGDFSVGAIGHYLSKGTRMPFKGVILSGNLFEMLSNVRAVGKDLTFYGSYGSPTLIIEGLKISGK